MKEKESNRIFGGAVLLCFLLFLLIVVMGVGMFVEDCENSKHTHQEISLRR